MQDALTGHISYLDQKNHSRRLIFCAGSHVLDEAERSLHDALCVLSAATADARVLYGGGWPEMQMAKVHLPCC